MLNSHSSMYIVFATLLFILALCGCLNYHIVFLCFALGLLICVLFLNFNEKTYFRLDSFFPVEKKVKFTPSNNKSVDICVCKELDSAFDLFYSNIILNFVCYWFHNFSRNDSVVYEAKRILRYASLKLICELKRIDASELIKYRLFPLFLKHLECHLTAEKIATATNSDFNKTFIEMLPHRVHIATTNRKNELKYLRKVADAFISPKVLPKSYFECRNFSILFREIIAGWVLLPMMDVVSDPFFINSLVVHLYDSKSKPNNISSKDTERVQLLEKFEGCDILYRSLSYDLNSLLKTPRYLYALIQFSKEFGCFNILKFCLDLDDFNNKLLNPDLNELQKRSLYLEITEIYSTYISCDSNEYIGCPADVADSILEILNMGEKYVGKFCTSPAVFKAYDYAFALLELKWLPIFYHSDEFFQLLCGPRDLKIETKKSERNMHEASHVKNDSDLKENVAADPSNFLSDPLFAIDSFYKSINRDMSSWNVSIPSVEVQEFSNVKTVIFDIFIQKGGLHVNKEEAESWMVQRKEQDFVILKNKLGEFHGDIGVNDAYTLPNKSGASLEIKQMRYEEFLQKLLILPKLKSSDLLHYFLTSPGNFSLLASSAAPIESIYYSVAHKLRKEKGQHLNFFMGIFLKSVEKKVLDVGEEASDEIFSNLNNQTRCLFSPVFKDNFGMSDSNVINNCEEIDINDENLFSRIYTLVQCIFKFPECVQNILFGLASQFKEAIVICINYVLRRRLKNFLTEKTFSSFINMLNGTIFERPQSPTDEEREAKRQLAYSKVNSYIPKIASCLIDTKCAQTILNSFQNPMLNKQLAYSLLDTILTEMYGENNI